MSQGLDSVLENAKASWLVYKHLLMWRSRRAVIKPSDAVFSVHWASSSPLPDSRTRSSRRSRTRSASCSHNPPIDGSLHTGACTHAIAGSCGRPWCTPQFGVRSHTSRIPSRSRKEPDSRGPGCRSERCGYTYSTQWSRAAGRLEGARVGRRTGRCAVASPSPPPAAAPRTLSVLNLTLFPVALLISVTPGTCAVPVSLAVSNIARYIVIVCCMCACKYRHVRCRDQESQRVQELVSSVLTRLLQKRRLR